MRWNSDWKPAPVDVLIAEDDPHIRRILRHVLEDAGYRCAEAVDGPEAVAKAQDHRPRCVLLDIVLPRMDGFGVAKHLRADPRTRQASIHCVTGCADMYTQEEARRAGCDAFLTKPIDFSALLELVGQDTQPDEPEWFQGLDKTAAEDLLDQLEREGWTDLKVTSLDGKTFAVRGRRPCPKGDPGLDPDEGYTESKSSLHSPAPHRWAK